jgi:hypothetical protein
MPKFLRNVNESRRKLEWIQLYFLKNILIILFILSDLTLYNRIHSLFFIKKFYFDCEDSIY